MSEDFTEAERKFHWLSHRTYRALKKRLGTEDPERLLIAFQKQIARLELRVPEPMEEAA